MFPPPLEHLTRANKVVEFASSLTEEQARTLTQRVVMASHCIICRRLHEAYDNRENAPVFAAAEQYSNRPNHSIGRRLQSVGLAPSHRGAIGRRRRLGAT
jgi:hypothetical protein